MSIAIRFEGVGKQYRLGEVGTGTISRDLERAWAKLRGRPDPTARIGTVNDREKSGGEYVWALKDVSFDVSQGEVLGIIGRNGAGKSTLLKLLSRVTAPTVGSIKAKGRIASLLEVGTGFHPELTGRENIFLNGAILGMTRHEINRRMEEIVEFSGCAKFIDTPVKRYSSGMTVRLGFAVAAHLECEALVVDEVLAVGDFEFQRRCLTRMSEVAREGRTVLFVSHNMAAIKNLTESVIVFDRGGLAFRGQSDEGIRQYLQLQEREVDESDLAVAPRGKGIHPAIKRCWLESGGKQGVSSVQMGEEFAICIAYEFPEKMLAEVPLTIGFGVQDSNGTRVFSINNELLGLPDVFAKRKGIARFGLSQPKLNQGRFFVSPSITLAGTEWLDAIDSAIAFDVVPSDVFGSGKNLLPTQGVTYVQGTIEFDCME